MKAEELKREFAEKWAIPISGNYDSDTDVVTYTTNADEIYSDLTALISEHYYPKEKYDELKDSLVDMVNQFAYRGTYEGRENMHTGGLSALEDAFATLGLSDPITLIDFYAAIKNTER